MWLVFIDKRQKEKRQQIFWIEFDSTETLGEVHGLFVEKYGFEQDMCMSIAGSPLNMMGKCLKDIPEIHDMCEIQINGGMQSQSLHGMSLDKMSSLGPIPIVTGGVKSVVLSPVGRFQSKSVHENVQELVKRGYDLLAAKSALAVSDNNLEAAIALLDRGSS
jgi:hypothetical protein